MANNDFQNGFALGLSAKGKVETPTQTKSLTITENGSSTVSPDSGYALSSVSVNVNVPQGITPLDYTVQCSAESQIVEKLTVKSGMKIPSPLYTPTSGSFFGWKDSDNNTIDFTNGYTVSKNETITAIIKSSYADSLYSAFNISKDTYQCVTIYITDSSTGLYFSNTVEVTNGRLGFGYGGGSGQTEMFRLNSVPLVTDINTVVQYCINNKNSFSYTHTTFTFVYPLSNESVYANYDLTSLTSTLNKYDLNTYPST